MTTLLKQSTATDVELGPFIDDADGKTPETALTISQADCQLIKNGGAAAQKNDATSATHLAGGHYKVPLNTTDTGTLGRLRLYVNESGALPIWRDFMVVPANVYDSLVGGSDVLTADVTQWNGTNVASPATAGYPAVTLKVGTGTGEASLSSGRINADVTHIATAAVSTTTAQLGVNVVQISGDGTAADNEEAFFDGTGYAGGTIKLGVDALAISGDTTAANNAESFFDGTGYAGTNNVIPTVTTVNGLAAGVITAAAIATGAIDADALAADAVDEILDEVVEGTLTLRQILRIVLAVLAGESTGGGTSTITFRDNADTKARVSATIDGSRNRTAVTLDGS